MSNFLENTERKVLSIAHIFLMVLALVAFVSAFGITIWSVFLMNQSVSDEITAPKPTYSDFKTGRTAGKKDFGQSQSSASDSEEKIYEKYKNLYINEIEISLLKFSQTADNVRTTENTPKRIFLRAIEFRKYINMDTFFAGLLEQCRELEKDAVNIGKLNKYDAGYVTWPEFLNFYFMKTMNDIQEQQRQKNILKQKIAADFEKGKKLLFVAGISFLMALFFVFYILLFNIERNLRRKKPEQNTAAEHSEAISPDISA